MKNINKFKRFKLLRNVLNKTDIETPKFLLQTDRNELNLLFLNNIKYYLTYIYLSIYKLFNKFDKIKNYQLH
jgi:hypothetical protein